MINQNKIESVNDFIENLYMLVDEGVISEFEYGRLIYYIKYLQNYMFDRR